MQAKYIPIFGDDGFRSKFGKGLMSSKNLEYFAHSLSKYVYKKRLNNFPIVIAKDTRISGEYIEKLLSDIIIKSGLNVTQTNILPTPGLSKLIEVNKYACGIMITASHNPSSDNGIKLFSKSGYKMKFKDEKFIEDNMREKNKIRRKYKPGIVSFKKNSGVIYCNNIIKDRRILTVNSKVAIDCSNGAMSFIIKRLFDKNRNFKIINCDPDGKNINYKCGALEASKLHKYIKKNNIDFGIAFDGDGDRSVFVSRSYGVVETEKLFYLFSTLLFKNLNTKSVVVSEVFNYGIIKLLEKKFKNVWVTKAGDRNVIEKVKQKNAILGAEPSGHFNYPKKSKSMDGLVTLVLFLKLLKKRGLKKLNLDIKNIEMFKRIKTDIKIKANFNNKIINKINKLCFSSNERLIARTSMWEPVLRIYYDYKSKNNYKIFRDKIRKLIGE